MLTEKDEPYLIIFLAQPEVLSGLVTPTSFDQIDRLVILFSAGFRSLYP